MSVPTAIRAFRRLLTMKKWGRRRARTPSCWGARATRASRSMHQRPSRRRSIP